MPSYNLVRKCWIPCRAEDGRPDYLGLRDVLVRAHELREVHDPSPLVTVALHRLLLAILHRNFGPANLPAWRKLQQLGRWDAAQLDTYFHARYPDFDLFSDTKPFFQDPYLASTDAEEPEEADDEGTEGNLVPISKLARELAATRNPTLFDHTVDLPPMPFPPDKAARYLIAAQAFALEDGRGYGPSPLTFGVSLLVHGDSLFETLLFNLLIYNSERPMPSDIEKDRPWWERASRTPVLSTPEGYVSYLTWPHRRILLHPRQSGGELSVGEVHLSAGQRLDKSWVQTLYDPTVSYTRSKSAGFTPVRLNEQRALWRDAAPLFQFVGNRYRLEPGFVNLLARADMGHRVVSAFGVVAKKNRIDMWRHERLPLPPAYLDNQELVAKLSDALDLAENAAKGLWGSVNSLAKLVTIPNWDQLNERDQREQEQRSKKAIQDLVRSLSPERAYWPHLETPFKQFLVVLPQDRKEVEKDIFEYGARAIPEWGETVRDAAQQAFYVVTRSLDTSARTLKAVSLAQRQFHRRIAEILGPYLKSKGGGT